MKVPVQQQLEWCRVAPYLDRALDLEPGEREAWFAELTTTQPDLAEAVRKLLMECELVDAKGFLATSSIENIVSLAGERVGAYTVQRLLGRGGMGEVWLASRSDGRFEGKCAIKFLDASIASSKLADRFRREGSLLARLTHPNIARLIDAGATDDGKPYLALEYVDGERIDHYCDSKGLSIDARVRLFVDVVAAVAHAHTHLIIHRDIKPSNVLVTRDGSVKLLDFGIAKLLSAEATPNESNLTVIEDAALTPEYAAPEQLLGELPSTATDVYQLGMLLYVLLTGKHPISSTGTRAEKIRAALDGVVPRASETVDHATRKKLHGDLDAILATALRKIPNERYATAQALQDELKRYLHREPVLARRGANWYRARKFVSRHRLAVVVAVVIVASLSVGLFTVNRERVIAERRFQQLRQLASKVFEFDKAIQDVPGTTDARHKLVAASLEYLDGLAADAHGDIDLAATLGQAYMQVAEIQGVPSRLNLGDYTAAEHNLKKADQFVGAVVASRPRDRKYQYVFAEIAHDRMILAQEEKRYVDSGRHAAAAADRIERYLAIGDNTEVERIGVAGLFGNIGLTYLNLNMYDDGVRAAQRMVALARTTASPEGQGRLSGGLSMLASALRLQGRLDDALIAIEEAKQIAEKTVYTHETHRMFDLYGIYQREGYILGSDGGVSLDRQQEAAAAWQKAFDLTEAGARRDAKDFGSRTRLGTAGRELGNLLRRDNPSKALAVYDLALERLAEIPHNLNARRSQAELLANSSVALRNLHRNSEAVQRIESALAILEETKDLPADHISLDGVSYVVLCAQADQQDYEAHSHQAIASYRELLKKLELSSANPRTDLRAAMKLSRLYQYLADLYARVGDAAQAKSFATQRLELWREWERKLPGNSFVTRQLTDQVLPASRAT